VGGVHGLTEEDEDIKVSAIQFADAFQMLEDGKIESGIPIIAIQWLYIHRDQLRARWCGVDL
jgi:ADP-ribose pyrophosphatase